MRPDDSWCRVCTLSGLSKNGGVNDTQLGVGCRRLFDRPLPQALHAPLLVADDDDNDNNGGTIPPRYAFDDDRNAGNILIFGVTDE